MPQLDNQTTSYNIQTSPKSSHWRYLFQATNYNWWNLDETNQNFKYLLYFPCVYNIRLTTDFCSLGWFYYIKLWRKKKFYVQTYDKILI